MPEVAGHLLLVDDEPGLLDLYTEILRGQGFAVTPCTSGAAALAALAEQAFDLVISDVRMPGLDGLGVLRAVREHDPDLPVVLTTGDPSLQGVSEALDNGALHYLIKPVAVARLVETAQRGVRLSRLARLKRDALEARGEAEYLVGDRIALEAAFARALRTLRMVYQPIVHSDGAGFGCEALVRCGEPLFPHPPALFLAATRLGRLHELGRAIRAHVGDALARQHVGGYAFVNLHPLELNDDALLHPGSPLARHASKVVLEVTERAHLDDVRNVSERVARLRELGFRIALDDLGGGYAGLTSFAALVPDFVKIDGELVKDIDRHALRRQLVGSIARVCGELGIPVVAEGIETSQEREAVLRAGCGLLQGFLIGRPAPPQLAGRD